MKREKLPKQETAPATEKWQPKAALPEGIETADWTAVDVPSRSSATGLSADKGDESQRGPVDKEEEASRRFNWCTNMKNGPGGMARLIGQDILLTVTRRPEFGVTGDQPEKQIQGRLTGVEGEGEGVKITIETNKGEKKIPIGRVRGFVGVQ